MDNTSNCTFCGVDKSSLYTCPRCNVTYCSVRCYQNQKHSQCSEQFYQNCVQEELRFSSDKRNVDGSDQKAKNETIAALKRLQEGETEELGIQDELLDSDDEEDIDSRLQGIDLDNPDKVWEKLEESEKIEFQKLVETGEIQKFIPEFVPWWDHNFNESKLLIDDVGNINTNMLRTEAYIKSMQEKIPQVTFDSIEHMSKLMGHRKPSMNIKFNILNVVYAYAYAMKYFRGDHFEYHMAFIEMCFLLSGNLRENQNFDSSDLAIESAASSVNQHSMISISPEFTKRIKHDVIKIIKGPSEKFVSKDAGILQNIFLLAALTDLSRVFKLYASKSKSSSGSVETGSKPPDFKFLDSKFDNGLFSDNRDIKINLSQVKKVIKKLEFYLSWVMSYYEEFKITS